jgi:hypothetical protein
VLLKTDDLQPETVALVLKLSDAVAKAFALVDGLRSD